MGGIVLVEFVWGRSLPKSLRTHPSLVLYCFWFNNLTEGLTTNTKLFEGDTSLLSFVHDTQTSANNLNKDLELISNWDFQWKINFNPDFPQQAQKLIFIRKAKKMSHPSIVFNNASVSPSSSQKHLGINYASHQFNIWWTSKIAFFQDKQNIRTTPKIIKSAIKIRNNQIYDLFFRSHLDCGDILHSSCPFTKNWNLFSIMPAWL